VKRFLGSFTAALALVLAVSSTAVAASPAAMYSQFLNASAAAVHARQVVSLASREITWLNNHKPARCYKNAWIYMRKSWTEFKKAYQAANRWLIAYPYGSAADFQTFETYNDLGATSMDKASYYMDLTTC